MEKLNMETIEMIVKTMAETAVANEKYFSDLDAVAGDADFGVSLANGFRIMLEKWDEFDRSSIGNFLMKVGMVITSNVGGCSGPIWGTGFIRAGMAAKDKMEVTLSEFVAMLRSAIEGMMARGEAQKGDKTLLDAIIPATDVLEEWSNKEYGNFSSAFAEATTTAEKMVEVAKEWEAKRGRQSFTGERSKGTLDPGMVAVATMMREVNTKLNES